MNYHDTRLVRAEACGVRVAPPLETVLRLAVACRATLGFKLDRDGWGLQGVVFFGTLVLQYHFSFSLQQ